MLTHMINVLDTTASAGRAVRPWASMWADITLLQEMDAAEFATGLQLHPCWDPGGISFFLAFILVMSLTKSSGQGGKDRK